MGKEYIPLFLDFNETTQDLTDEECGRLIRAIVDYANDADYEERLTGGEKIAFRFLKGLVDRNAAIAEKRAKAGSTTSKNNQAESNTNKEEQTETNEIKRNQNKTKTIIETNTKAEIETKNKTKEQMQQRFDRFWSAYPRHEARAVAQRAFEKINPDDELLSKMLMSIEKHKQTTQWQENGGQFIPHPATWLNQRRWEDEVKQAQVQKLPAQSYSQRDYKGEQEEAMRRMMENDWGETG